MSYAEAKAIVRSRGFSLKRLDSEYRLCPIGKGEGAAYYSDDLDDIVATATNWR